MKIFISLLLLSRAAFAQVPPSAQSQKPGRGPEPLAKIFAQPQPAQTVTTALTPDLATALESLRLSTPGPRDATGVSKPMYATIQDLWDAIILSPDGVLSQLLRQFPSATIRAKQDAVTKAQADADAELQKALPTKKAARAGK